MSTLLDLIRIRGYEGGPAEAFQGIGGGDATATPTNPTTPPKPGEEKLTDVTGNQDFNKVLTAYITVLTASGANKKPNWSALNNQLDLIARADTLWTTGDHNPSKEVMEWLKDADDYSTKLEQWFEDELAAQYAKQQAQDALDQATTDAERAAAQAAFDAAATMSATADGELPANNPVNKLVAIIAISRALMAGQWVLAAIIAIRMGVPMLIDYLVKWVKGKLPGKNPTHKDLQKLIEAVESLQYNDEEIDFGAFRAYLRSKVIES